jgi:rRNA maturation protein Rpf1
LLNALALATPADKIIRGKKNFEELLRYSSEKGAALALVYEKFGNPAGLKVFEPSGQKYLCPFSGVNVVRGLRSLLQKAKVGRVVVSNKQPVTEDARSLRNFFVSLPTEQSGQLVAHIDTQQKEDREIISLSVEGVECVSFYFRVKTVKR